MPLNGIYGLVGSGKNVISMCDLYFTPKEVPIYTNFKTTLKNAQLIEPEEVFEVFEEDTKTPIVKLVTDEAYSWFESRGSGFSDLNRFLSYLMCQSRKRGLNWYSIAQLRGTLDLRWRGQEDLVIYAKQRKLDSAGNSTDDFHYALMKAGKIITGKMLYEDVKNLGIFEMYDTKQVILPPDFLELKQKLQFKKNPDLLNKLIDDIVLELLKTKASFPCKIQKDGTTKYSITQDWIKDKILRTNPKHLEWSNYVTIRLKAILIEE